MVSPLTKLSAFPLRSLRRSRRQIPDISSIKLLANPKNEDSLDAVDFFRPSMPMWRIAVAIRVAARKTFCTPGFDSITCVPQTARRVVTSVGLGSIANSYGERSHGKGRVRGAAPSLLALLLTKRSEAVQIATAKRQT